MEKEVVIKRTERLQYLDGVRGIASVFVVFCHLACIFVPNIFFFEQATTKYDKVWLYSPLNVITNGNAAVICFFFMSGFLIARRNYINSKSIIVESPFKEYRKLLRVVVPGVLLSALLMQFGLMYHLKAASEYPLLSFVNDYCNFKPTFFGVINDALFSTFIKGSKYVGPFWTICYEFFGALIIKTVSFFAVRNGKYSKLYYLVFSFLFLFIYNYIVAFFSGAFIFECVYDDGKSCDIIDRFVKFVFSKKYLFIPFFIIGLYFACINLEGVGIYSIINYIPLLGKSTFLFRTFGISICFLCIEKIGFLQKVLSMSVLKWLGSISAYTYAFHFPIILSAGCGVFLVFVERISYYGAVIIASVVSIILTLLLSYFYTKLSQQISKFGDNVIKSLKSRISAMLNKG